MSQEAAVVQQSAASAVAQPQQHRNRRFLLTSSSAAAAETQAAVQEAVDDAATGDFVDVSAVAEAAEDDSNLEMDNVEPLDEEDHRRRSRRSLLQAQPNVVEVEAPKWAKSSAAAAAAAAPATAKASSAKTAASSKAGPSSSSSSSSDALVNVFAATDKKVEPSNDAPVLTLPKLEIPIGGTVFALPELPLGRLTAFAPGPAPVARAPMVQVGDLSAPDAPVGTGESGVKISNPFAPEQSVSVGVPEKAAPEAAAAAKPVAAAAAAAKPVAAGRK